MGCARALSGKAGGGFPHGGGKCSNARERFRCGRQAASLIVAAAAFVLLTFLPGQEGARAQTGPQKPIIAASKYFHLTPGTDVPLDITLWPPEAVEPGSTLMIRGLPPRVDLVGGKLVMAGIWGVPADAPGPVKLVIPAGSEGVSELTIMLVGANGSLVTELRSTLVIKSPGSAVIPPLADPKPNQAPVPALPAKLTKDARDKALKLMERGDQSLASGNVTVARLFYQTAVELGWGPAAISLGGTYDPAELEQLNVMGGLQPDLQLAKKWYTRAQELGAGEARERLQRLAR